MRYGPLIYVFFVAVMLLWGGIHWFTCKKFKIKNQIPYKHINKIHQRTEFLLLLAALLGPLVLFLISRSTNYVFKFYNYFFLYIFIVSVLRAFMEWKYDEKSKRYTLSITAAIFTLIIFLGLELIFHNPVPVKIEAKQVEEIVLVQYADSQKKEEIILSDETSFNPILSAISNGSYKMERSRFLEPNQSMAIILKNGSRIVIDRLNQFTDATFMVYTERMFFPRDMIMQSPELERIFKSFAPPTQDSGASNRLKIRNPLAARIIFGWFPIKDKEATAAEA